MNESIFEVTRNEYKGLIQELKPNGFKVENVDLDRTHTVSKIFSLKTGKCICSRITHHPKYSEPEPEKYFIFELPDNDERNASVPVYHLNLETKEEVQAFFDFLSKQNKEKAND